MCRFVYARSARGGGNLKLAPQGFRGVEKVSKKSYISDILHHYKNKKGFTLAEVLITIGIIGVVAAMTMPNLIASYRAHETAAKLNKFYSVISNAYIRAKEDNGDISSWNLVYHEDSTNDEEDILFYLLPYLNVVKNCGRNLRGCAPKNIAYAPLGSTEFGTNIDMSPFYGKAILSDGSMISSLTFGNSCTNSGDDKCAIIRIDVNGVANPNRLGVDLFSFIVYKDKIVPGGIRDALNSDYYINRGDLCTAYVMYEKKMDYLKDKRCEPYK